MYSPKPLPASTALTATLDSSIAVNKEQFLWMWHFADFTIYTVGLTQWAAAGDPLSQIVFPDHSELPPHAAFQMQQSLRFNHRPHSLMSHIQLPALANLLFSQDAGRHGCKHSRQSSAKYGRKGTTADVMTPKQYRVLLRSSAVGRSLRPVMGIRLFDDLGTDSDQRYKSQHLYQLSRLPSCITLYPNEATLKPLIHLHVGS